MKTASWRALALRVGAAWRNLILPWWQEFRWPVIGLLWLVALILGYVGADRYYALTPSTPRRPHSDALYSAIQLFFINWGNPGPEPWQLEIARFLAPLVAFFTAMEALATVFYEQIQHMRMRRIRGHVIVCGLGEKGLRLAKAFREDGYRVVVIEQNGSNDLIPSCREVGAFVMLGNATEEGMLVRERVHEARYVVAVCGDDGANAEVAARTRDLVGSSKALTCVAHIVDPELWYLLRKWETATAGAFRLQFFNVFDAGARAMLSAYPPFGNGAKSGSPPHLLVVGAGRLGQSLIVNTARAWRDASQPADKLQITVVDPLADDIVADMCVHNPELPNVCALTTHSVEVGSPEFQRASFLADGAGRPDVSSVYVCVDNDARSLGSALSLLPHLKRTGVPIIVRMTENAGLATLLDDVGSRGGSGLRVFGLLDSTCQPEVVLGGTTEILARSIHAQYLQDQARLGHTVGDNPSLVSWDVLPEDLKESNRRQAGHISVKLNAIGCDLAPLTDWNAGEFTFSAEEVDKMARLEHERWVSERKAAGWTFGPRNPERKTNPNLVPWADLPEESREFNRDFIRALPISLARAGFQIYRMQ